MNLWNPRQEWIQTFDKIIKYPPQTRRGCSVVACQTRRSAGINSKKKDNTGDVEFDEDSFIHQFPATGLVTVQTLRGLETQLMTIWTGLKSLDWRRKVKSLQLLRNLVACGAGRLDEFVGILINWAESLRLYLTDIRTQVVRACCLTVAYLAQEIGYKVIPVITHLLPSILQLLQHKSKFIIVSGIVCIRFIIQNTYSPR